MRHRLIVMLILGLLVLFASACQGIPPTQIVLVVTATPAPEETGAVATAEVTAELSAEVQSATTAVTATTAPATPAPPSPTANVTPLPPNFPTPVASQIQVAEQLFERGRMFWLQPTQEVWVLVITSEGRGTWSVYRDEWVDGEPETDPNLTAPEGLIQPERGFGKLWRETPGLRDQLGWAVTPEFGYVSGYEYHAGGSVNAGGTYTAGPGYHILYSLYGELFRFNEVDSTWQLGRG